MAPDILGRLLTAAETIWSHIKIHKQSGFTAVGREFLYEAVYLILDRSFDIYNKKNLEVEYPGVSLVENSLSFAGIALSIIGLEAYRNILLKIEKKNPQPNVPVATDLTAAICSKFPVLSKSNMQQILDEIFVLRDVIVHSHVYDVEESYSEDWNLIKSDATLATGYGNKKFRGLSKTEANETAILKFNLTPYKISFEDFFVVMATMDTFVAIIQNNWNVLRLVPHFIRANRSATNINDILSYYYNLIPSSNRKASILKRVEQLCYLSDFTNDMIYKVFIKNRCQQCGTFGFRNFDGAFKCAGCGAVIVKHKLDFLLV